MAGGSMSDRKYLGKRSQVSTCKYHIPIKDHFLGQEAPTSGANQQLPSAEIQDVLLMSSTYSP